ncbi:pentapeptide repeat-containing protein [Pseudoscardovia radai]|uniref:pentapeptide repeat-containing protein n=1 Tax=Pseudoscardovia radai TaxID=987066 RepID=UPI003992540A
MSCARGRLRRLRGCDLRCVSLRHVSLRHVSLRHVSLCECDNARLDAVGLHGGDLAGEDDHPREQRQARQGLDGGQRDLPAQPGEQRHGVRHENEVGDHVHDA